jgi:hypothetical protein
MRSDPLPRTVALPSVRGLTRAEFDRACREHYASAPMYSIPSPPPLLPTRQATTTALPPAAAALAYHPANVRPAGNAAAWLAANPALPPMIGGGPAGPTDADWDEYHRWSEWQDRLEAIYWTDGDQDAAADSVAIG